MARQRSRNSRRTADSTQGWFASLSTGAKRLVAVIAAVGAIATAIAAVMALWAPSPELGAEVQAVSAGGMTLDEYVRRHDDETALAPGGRPSVELAAYRVAQAQPTTPASPDGPTTDPNPTTTEDPSTTGTNGTDTEPGGPSTASPPLGTRLRAGLHQGIVDVLTDPATSNLSIPDQCAADIANPACGRTLTYMVIEPDGQDPPPGDDSASVAERIGSVFKLTRTGPPDPVTGKRPLRGIDVNFDVSLTGFRGSTAEVHWSLHQVGGDLGAVPNAWFDKRVLLLKPDADKDKASPEFWVPLPRRAGPFFLRVSIIHDGTRLAQKDSPRFE